MTLRDRIGTLRARHAEIDEAIRTENARPHPDEGHLADLKRQKLRLKDQIALMAEDTALPGASASL